MTYARAHLVDSENGGFYHCISRCVRRAWLCGIDPLSGQSYEHRREWVERRVLMLSDIFSVELYAYAVMSNHYHLVVKIDPYTSRQWTSEEVAQRWLRLRAGANGEIDELQARALASDETRIAILRQRLASLSWFMRYINETIARRANREDRCKGHFWEGRFKSIALLDEASVVACMAYVDLNPIRAKTSNVVVDSPHTSIRRRTNIPDAIPVLARLELLGFSHADYVSLLCWTVHAGKSSNSAVVPQLIIDFGLSSKQWLRQVAAHRHKYRAYGALSKLQAYAQRLGQRWLKGTRATGSVVRD